ncbi:hypothetical protein M3Y97_00647000 [Aphelenchoides bicaudatus]|nr:hypothetical protein M3Y97_00647000 [Aphelenchoides bicaudatus]
MEEAPSPEAKKPKIERKDQAREAIESTWKANRRRPKHFAQTIESALFHSTDLKLFTNMRYCDGRLAYFCCEDDSNTSTTFCCEDDSDTSTTTLILDLFTGTKRVLKNPKGNFSLQNAYPIKGDYFLKAIRLNGNFKQIQVFQVDRNNWSIKEVGFYDVSSDLASFIVDPMNYRKFLFWSNEQFQLGGTEDNKLIAGPTRHYLIGELIYPKLDGHKLLGFRERDY